MAIKLQHDYEVGNGLEISGNKATVKPDNTGNVQFEVSAAGLKGTVTLPQAFDPSALEQKIQEAKDAAAAADTKATTANEKNTTQDGEIATLKQQAQALEQAKTEAEAKVNELQEALNQEKAKVQVLEGKVTALENREDLHASGLRLDDATNEVVLTVEGGSELRVGLGKFLNVVPTSQSVWDEIKALPTFKADLLAVLKGEEVQDFAGTTKGFLLPSA